eukprot:2578038-Rhodomonas_salina.1
METSPSLQLCRQRHISVARKCHPAGHRAQDTGCVALDHDPVPQWQASRWCSPDADVMPGGHATFPMD